MSTAVLQAYVLSISVASIFIFVFLLILMSRAAGQDQKMKQLFKYMITAAIIGNLVYLANIIFDFQDSFKASLLLLLILLFIDVAYSHAMYRYMLTYFQYKEVPVTSKQSRRLWIYFAVMMVVSYMIIFVEGVTRATLTTYILRWVPTLIFNIYAYRYVLQRREKLDQSAVRGWGFVLFLPMVISILFRVILPGLDTNMFIFLIYTPVLYIAVQAQDANLITMQLQEANDRLKERESLQNVINALAFEYETVISLNLYEDNSAKIYKLHPRVVDMMASMVEGKSYTELQNVLVEKIVYPEDKESVRDMTRLEQIRDGMSWPESRSVIYRNVMDQYGEEKIVRISKNVVVIGFANKDQEIRQEMEQKRQLEQALEEANAASRAKTDFLSNMSHDIRTPMNAIVGYTDMSLRHQDDHHLLLDSLHRISQASEQLLNLINDILDMSRIESGKIEVQEEPTSIPECMDNLRSIFSSQAKEKNIQLKVEADEVEHTIVMCDRKLIDRMLMNLISNSLKFTRDNGNVSVKVKEISNGSDSGAIYRIIVADNGIGMSEEFVEKIFEPFERERTSTVSGLQGTGLGMAIVGNIVRILNGSIDVQSQQGYGSTFTIDIPFAYTDQQPVNAKEIQASLINTFENKVVLLTEDMLVNRELARVILEELELTVEIAENGKEAVDMFSENPDRYDLILMDVQMPVMDGYTATSTIRALDIPRAKTIPIIAMTANAFAEDRQKAIQVGMDDHIAKPIDVQQLNKTLSKYLR